MEMLRWVILGFFCGYTLALMTVLAVRFIDGGNRCRFPKSREYR